MSIRLVYFKWVQRSPLQATSKWSNSVVYPSVKFADEVVIHVEQEYPFLGPSLAS